jgi:hypothetical protein
MPKQIHNRGLLRPADMQRLQRVFDEVCRRREVLPEIPDAREIALTLLALYEGGMTGEDMLVSAMAFSPPETKSA